ncbi:MAG TPA: nuclear transport factor 2 family protein [Actinomycetota bacterium]|nr:nuclear transport factor 2 family protein [Actinomycetota bacterium]
MKPELIEKVRAALEGWLKGDTIPLEALLHPDVELLWWKTGEWDIHGKDQVLGMIKQRAAQRASEVMIDVSAAGEDALIVTRVAPPEEGQLPATLITFKNGLIVQLHQFRTAEEASKAAPWRTRA